MGRSCRSARCTPWTTRDAEDAARRRPSACAAAPRRRSAGGSSKDRSGRRRAGTRSAITAVVIVAEAERGPRRVAPELDAPPVPRVGERDDQRDVAVAPDAPRLALEALERGELGIGGVAARVRDGDRLRRRPARRLCRGRGRRRGGARPGRRGASGEHRHGHEAGERSQHGKLRQDSRTWSPGGLLPTRPRLAHGDESRAATGRERTIPGGNGPGHRRKKRTQYAAVTMTMPMTIPIIIDPTL